MSNAWDDMKKAKEDSYFAKKDQEALARLAKKQHQEKPRLSPVTGEEMEQVVLNGVVIDRCKTSGGIWLDAGELEQLLEASRGEQNELKEGRALLGFLKGLVVGKKE
jgi:hypothetical protein